MHRIVLSPTSLLSVDYIADWCIEQFGEDGWTVGVNDNGLYWQFDQECDATLFALRWG